MRYLLGIVVVTLIAILLWPSYDLEEKFRMLSGKPEVFFDISPNEYLPESDENISILFTKNNFKFEVPKNSLVRINHSYMPSAKEIWDSFQYWVIWPTKEGRTTINISLFRLKEASDVLKINVRAFGSELGYEDYTLPSRVKKGTKLKTETQPLRNLERFIFSGSSSSEYPSYFYQSKRVLPSGFKLQVKCRIPNGSNNSKRHRTCKVKFILPIATWKKEQREGHIGYQCIFGIQVEYSYHEKWIASWQEIHDWVLADISKKLVSPKLVYNNQTQPEDYGCGL